MGVRLVVMKENTMEDGLYQPYSNWKNPTPADLRLASDATLSNLTYVTQTERYSVSAPEAAFDLLYPIFDRMDREACVSLLLDHKHRFIAAKVESVGSVEHTFMSPRELLRSALMANAAAMVLAHNHPSGDPEPSKDDERVTRRIVQAADVVGVSVLDHLVIGGARWVSLARRGKM